MEETMRIDKFLKISKLIKRRTIAAEACQNERILINNKTAKPSSQVKENDIITIVFNNKTTNYKVLKITSFVRKNDPLLYEVINE